MLITNKTAKYNYNYKESYSFSIPSAAIASIVKEVNTPTILDHYSYYIEQQRKLVGRGKEEGTIRTYLTRFRIIKDFIISKHSNYLYPKDFTIKIIREFEIFLRAHKKYTNDYTMKNIQLIGRILKLALEAGEIDFNPVSELYQFHYERSYDPTFLEIDELRLLQKKQFKQDRLEKVKDVFLFCCYTGLTYVDVSLFRRSLHIVTGIDSKPWILLKRKKNTQKNTEDTHIPLLPIALDILEKYGNEQLPVLSNDKMNSYLKEIIDIVGIKKDITTKTARKTFGMLLYEEYNVPLATVSRMLGHSTVKTTEQWYVKTRMKKVIHDLKDSYLFFTDSKKTA